MKSVSNLSPDAYVSRPIVCIGEWEVESVQFKVYKICSSIASSAQEPSIKAARQFVSRIRLPAEGRFGFVTIHHGTEAVWLLVDVWVDDTLHHQLFQAPVSSPTAFVANEGTEMACVWELPVIWHEREAWVKHVMQDQKADYEAYLTDTITLTEA